MELGRLLPKPLSKIGTRYRGFREFLAEVLEGNRSLLGENEDAEIAPPFEVSNRFEFLRAYSHRHHSLNETFTGLAPYFEAGAILIQKNGGTRLTGFFLEGKTYLNENDAPVVELGLSELKPGVIVKGRIAPALRVLGLGEAKRLFDSDAFAFSPKTGVVLLLICNRPRLWQTEALEEAFHFASDFVSGSSSGASSDGAFR
ncbi:MAG: hypothetical protein V4692_14510 [Bdellovibrionota bacterium]